MFYWVSFKWITCWQSWRKFSRWITTLTSIPLVCGASWPAEILFTEKHLLSFWWQSRYNTMIGVDGGVRRATTSKLSASAGDDHPADASPERPYVGKTIRPASQIWFFLLDFQRIILTSKGRIGANADEHFHQVPPQGLTKGSDSRAQISDHSSQLNAAHTGTQQCWEVVVIMPTLGFPLKVIKMVVMRTISSLLRSTLLPQFTTIRNAVTAILHVEGKFHVSLSYMVHNWKRKFAEGSLRWKSPVTGARYFRTRQNQLLEPDNFLRPLVSESQFKWEKFYNWQHFDLNNWFM